MLTWSMLAVACAPLEYAELDDVDGGYSGAEVEWLELELAERMPTVATVRWETAEPTLGRIWYGVDGEPMLATALEGTADTVHEAVLVGLPELASASLQVEIVGDDGDTWRTEPVAFQTGALPAVVPRPTVSTIDEAAMPAGFMLVPIGDETARRRWATILDPRGRLVWALEVDETAHRMRQSLDGEGVIWAGPGNPIPAMALNFVDWNGTLRSQLNVPEGFQDFDQVDDDTFVALTTRVETLDFTDGPADVVDDGIVEIDLDGGLRQLWQSTEDLPLDTDQPAPGEFLVNGAIDWVHANFLQYDPALGAACATLRNFHAATCVDVESATPLWLLGNDVGELQVAPGTRPLLAPHSVQLVSGGVLLYEQGNGGDHGCAGANRYEIDPQARQFAATWSYESEDCLFGAYLGNAQQLDGGQVLVDFSVTGRIDLVSAEGALVQRLELAAGDSFLYAEWLPSIGQRLR